MASFRPFDIEGIPIEEQFESYNDMIKEPFDKDKVDAFSRTRVILMNGIENNSVITKHAIDRMVADDRTNKDLAMIRRVDSLQQQTVNWLIPANETILETTIGFEQVAVELTADLAKNEENPYFKQVLDFALLEDFDHLYRHSELMRVLGEGDGEKITQGKTDIKPGRPTKYHHRHPSDGMRRHFTNAGVNARTKMNYHTIVSAEQQTMLFYKSHGMTYENDLARRLFSEIADVEQEHVSQYEMAGDPSASPLEISFLVEVNEAYNYFCCAQSEPDPRLRALWDRMCRMEITHAQMVGDMLRKKEGKDPVEVLGADKIDSAITFEANRDYVDRILDEQVQYQPYNLEFVPEPELPKDWPSFAFRDRMNAGTPPSEEVVSKARGAPKQEVRTGPRT